MFIGLWFIDINTQPGTTMYLTSEGGSRSHIGLTGILFEVSGYKRSYSTYIDGGVAQSNDAIMVYLWVCSRQGMRITIRQIGPTGDKKETCIHDEQVQHENL